MIDAITDETLGRLDTEELGSGATPSTEVGDDRAGRYWKVVDPTVTIAAKVALITGRPLLLEGLSGVGKSSLARALAETLGWVYYETVVTSRTELPVLTGMVDHVRRLYEAEYSARTGDTSFDGDLERFLTPGVLWWAFDPTSAAAPGVADPGIAPARTNEAQPGAVVLVDELDKADPDLPNNLLVPFGSMQLSLEGRATPVLASRPVLLCVTSNRERDLPPAFLRRCVALELDHPNPAQLVQIAEKHVAGNDVPAIASTVARRFLGGAATVERRPMSAAEFVDAVRAAVGLGLDPNGEGSDWDDVQALFEATHERRTW